MIKVQTFSVKGVKGIDEALPKEFDQKTNMVHIFQERSHVGLRNTKTRSEINRTGKKVYKQKGTGGARHGSRRANLFVGGGVIFGPRPEKRILTLPGSMKARARLLAYTLKAKENELIFVSGISKIEKTKAVSELTKTLTKATGAKRFTFVLSEGASSVIKYFRNFVAANAIYWKDANAYDIFNGGMIVMDEGIFEGSKVNESSKSIKSVKIGKTVKAVKTVKKTTKTK
jgi:large subunit ribosomal protein L4